MSSFFSTGQSEKRLVVGVADMKCSGDPEGVIVTHALGSCIGITIYDPVVKVGGMLHYMLAQARDKEKAEKSPFMYALSGVPALFRAVYELGGEKERLIVCAAGGAEILNDEAGFSIGKRNHTILRKLFWKNGIVLHGEDCGGNSARHFTIDLATGKVVIQIKREEKVLWPR